MTLQEVKDKLVAVGLEPTCLYKNSEDVLIELPGPLTYVTLAKVAEALSTDRIDIDSGAAYDSCCGVEQWVELTVFGVLDNA